MVQEQLIFIRADFQESLYTYGYIIFLPYSWVAFFYDANIQNISDKSFFFDKSFVDTSLTTVYMMDSIVFFYFQPLILSLFKYRKAAKYCISETYKSDRSRFHWFTYHVSNTKASPPATRVRYVIGGSRKPWPNTPVKHLYPTRYECQCSKKCQNEGLRKKNIIIGSNEEEEGYYSRRNQARLNWLPTKPYWPTN